MLGTDEAVFNMVLCSRSYPHLKAMFEKYRSISGKGIVDSISSEMSGTLKEGFLAIGNFIFHFIHFIIFLLAVFSVLFDVATGLCQWQYWQIATLIFFLLLAPHFNDTYCQWHFMSKPSLAIGLQGFYCSCPSVWNSLPASVCDFNLSLENFRQKLIFHLYIS